MERRPLLNDHVSLSRIRQESLEYLRKWKHPLTSWFSTKGKAHEILKALDGELLKVNTDGEWSQVLQDLIGALHSRKRIRQIETNAEGRIVNLAHDRSNIRGVVGLVILQGNTYTCVGKLWQNLAKVSLYLIHWGWGLMPAAHRAKQMCAHSLGATKGLSKVLRFRYARANLHFNTIFLSQISSPIEHLIIERI